MKELPLQTAHEPTKVACIGDSGTGKSTWVTEWINQCLDRNAYEYYFIFDHEGQFAQRNGLQCAYTWAQLAAQIKKTRFGIFNTSEIYTDPKKGLAAYAHYAFR